MAFLRKLLTAEQFGELTDSEVALIDFVDKQHDRLIEKNNGRRPELENLDGETAENCLANIGKNTTEAYHESRRSVLSANATVDIANLAFIADTIMSAQSQN